jgi:hypothetical protein
MGPKVLVLMEGDVFESRFQEKLDAVDGFDVLRGYEQIIDIYSQMDILSLVDEDEEALIFVRLTKTNAEEECRDGLVP